MNKANDIMMIKQLVLTLLFSFLLTTTFAAQYKPNGEITVNSYDDWQNISNWVAIDGGISYPQNGDEIVLGSNAKLNLNFNLNDYAVLLYITFQSDGFLQIQTEGELYILGSIVMDQSNVEMKVYGKVEIENNFSLDNGNFFVKDGGNAVINGDFIRSDLGSGQFEIGGETTVFTVYGNFDDQHNTPHIYNSPDLNIQGNCTTKTGSFCETYLPIALISFNASYHKNDILLTWKTASEQNNDKFIIHRSVDLKEWEIIGEIEGQGNSNTLVEYHFTDRIKGGGRYYYQLEQIDFDKNTEMFGPIIVHKDISTPEVAIYNNIQNQKDVRLFYSLKEIQYQVRVIQSNGKVISSLENSPEIIPNYSFSRGMNILVIEGGKERYVFKILK